MSLNPTNQTFKNCNQFNFDLEERLMKEIGKVGRDTMQAVNTAIKLSLDID
jgi:hypothetical protein